MFNSLNRKIVLILAATMIIFTVVNMMVNSAATGTYLREVHQKLYKDFAKALSAQYFASEGPVLKKGRIARLFRDTLEANSNVAIYLLDDMGKVICSSERMDTLERSSVDMNPVRAFMAADAMFPILGEDPHGESAENIFSVAPIMHDGSALGYIYVMLDVGEDSIISMLQSSANQPVVALITIAAFALIFVFGASLMIRSTRKVKRLQQQVTAFEESKFKNPDLLPAPEPGVSDELDQMQAVIRSMAEKISQQILELEESHQFGIDLIRNLSHDLRTPLANVFGYIECVQKKPDLEVDERERLLTVALNNVSKLNGLLNELSSLISLENNVPLATREELNINEILAAVLDDLPATISCKLVTSLQKGNYLFKAEPHSLSVALKNLMVNGVNKLEAEVLHLETRLEGESLILTMRDSARSLNQESVRNYFSRYFRESGNPLRNDSGIETALAKRILHGHGAQVTAESRPESGTVIRVAFPLIIESRL